MRTTASIGLIGCAVALALALFGALSPTLALAGSPAQDTESDGLLGPIVVLLVLVLLNVCLLAFAFRLRRYFRELGDKNDKEQIK